MMSILQRSLKTGLLGWLGWLIVCHRVSASVALGVPVINSISVVETNLVFTATFPSGVGQATLEMRTTLADEWQSAAALNVPAEGGTINFSIPMPAEPSAFFRLKVLLSDVTNARPDVRLSPELQFVAVPPLGPDGTNTNEAVFHFKGMIDGSDCIIIRRPGALWDHVNWSWPADAMVNGARWNPSEKNYMSTTGAVLFLSQKYSLSEPRLEMITGRDVVALELTNDALIIYLDDTPVGAAPYEFKVHFPLADRQPKARQASQVATLKIAAVIDGSDLLKITKDAATWKHRDWAAPAVVKLNDFSWDLRQTNTWANTGTNRFLRADVDLSTAKIVRRQGRDLVTMWADQDAVWINFADNPNGANNYEVELSFANKRDATSAER
jgi:hypothetical protein